LLKEWLARSSTALRFVLPVLLLLCVVRLWLLPLRSGFWVDEMVTAFVVQHGSSDPSLAIAPQVTKSIYYVLPKAAIAMFGSSELVYRLPSLILAGIALIFVTLIARRLIRRDAGWFAVFACFGLRSLDYEAGDARPYALGICVAAGALLFLIRWLDDGRLSDGALFVIFAAMLWRVQLVYWPVYIVFALYAIVRVLKRDTGPSPLGVAVLFAIVGLTLIPVLLDALPLFREARAHVIVELPDVREIWNSLKIGLFLTCGLGALAFAYLFDLPRVLQRPQAPTVVILLGWWLCAPVGLFAMSWITGNSLFVQRYMSESLPGTALGATLAASLFLPSGFWKPAAAMLGLGILLFTRAPHQASDWRAASKAIHQLGITADTPVIVPSPFIEARSPVWTPDYALPGFLYCHLDYYPVQGKLLLFPFEGAPEGRSYAKELVETTLSSSPRFVIYGGDLSVRIWRDWFQDQPQFEGWRERSLGQFGDVEAVVFERTVDSSSAARIEFGQP